MRAIQKLIIGIVLRVVHAALEELRVVDSRVRQELEAMPAGTSYVIRTGHGAPVLQVEWDGTRLCRRRTLDSPTCSLSIKSVPLAFRLFTGRMGLAQAYTNHAFTLAGDVADVMKLARMVNIVEAYLFPRFITRRILTDIPPGEVCFLRVYGRIFRGFLTARYRFR